MNDQPRQAETIDDIHFPCPLCGKELSIERRGEGLEVTCPGCGGEITVPNGGKQGSPAPADAQTMKVEELSRALEVSRQRVDKLTTTLEEYRARRSYLEELRASNMQRFKAIAEDMATIRAALDRVDQHLQDARTEKPG